MDMVFWDASALAKRYTSEHGADVVDWLFANLSHELFATTSLSYLETNSRSQV